MTTEPSAAERREAVAADYRAHHVFEGWDKPPDAPAYWFRLPSWVQEYAAECVRATEQRLALPLASPSTAVGAGEIIPLYSFDEAWDELVNKDDRTSPEDYPDMCLIARDELRCYMEARQYDAPATKPASEDGAALREAALSALRAERAKPVSGPEHGAWDRGRRYGLDDAIRIVAALAPAEQPGNAEGQAPGSFADLAEHFQERGTLDHVGFAEQPVELAAQEAVSDAVHDALWKADAEIARLREALNMIAALNAPSAQDVAVQMRRMARAALSLDANGGGL